MPTYVKGQPFKPQFDDNNGNLLSSGTAEFYIWDTATPTAVYTDSAGSGSATTVTFNTRGEPANDIFYDTAVTYKIVLKDAAGATIDTLGPYIPAVGESFVTALTDIRYGRVFATVAAAKADTTLLNGQAVFILGYSAANDGGGGTYQYDSSSAATINNATVFGLDTLPGRLLHTFTTEVNSDTWGIVRTNLSADQATKVQAYRDWCEANGIETIINSGTVRIDSAIDIDLGLASFTCRKTLFDCTNLAAGNGFNIFSSLDFPELANNCGVAGGFTMSCGQTAGRHAIQLGHSTYTQSSQITLENVGIVGFDQQLRYVNNSWRILHRNIRLENPLNYYIYYYNVSNSGEMLKYDHLMIADGQASALFSTNSSRCQVVMNDLSLLNASLDLSGDVGVKIYGCNLENPGGTAVAGYRMISVNDDSTSCHIFGGELVINDPTGGNTFDLAPFVCNSAVGGLHFYGFHFPSKNSIFIPENDTNNSNERLLVYGTGRVTVTGGTTYGNIGSNADVVIARQLNVLSNGNAEYTDASCWTQADYGTGSAATFTATAGSKKNGSYGFHLDCVDTTRGTAITQDVPCKPMQYVACTFWTQWIAGTVVFQLRFLDLEGSAISSPSEGSYTISSGGTFVCGDISAIAPLGTATVRIEINGNTGGANPSECYVDDIVMNIM